MPKEIHRYIGPDTLEVTSTETYGGNIMSSLVGALIGIALFLGSFGVLFWNEGRADLSEIAKLSIPLDAQTKPATDLDGKLVSVTAPITTNDLLSDNLYLKPEKILALKRIVEMYAWEEESESHSSKSTGGKKTTTTRYNYFKEWTQTPEKSSSFKDSSGHQNPPKPLENVTLKAPTGKMGLFNVEVSKLNFNDFQDLPINPHTIRTAVPSYQTFSTSQGYNNVLARPAFPVNGQYVFQGLGTIASPQVGDIRTSYEVVKSGFTGTLFGKLQGNLLTTYTDKNGNTLFNMLEGDREDAIGELKAQHSMMTWILRVAGFLMMIIGLTLILNPVSTMLDFIPILGSMARSMGFILVLIISVFLSAVTIIVSIIVHNIIYFAIFAVGLLLLVGAIAGVAIIRSKNAQGSY